MNDEEWDDLKARIQEAYNPPSEAPREEMWAAICQQLPDAGQGGSGSLSQRPPWLRRGPWLAAAAALVLALGYGLGRWTAPIPGTPGERIAVESPPRPTGMDEPGIGQAAGGEAPTATVVSDAPDAPATRTAPPGATAPGTVSPRVTASPNSAYRFAAARHLAASSTFLGRIQNDVRDGAVPADAGDWARDLLMETRLILDSPAVEESDLRTLLEDLELLLLQIAHASGAQQSGPSDLGRIELQQLNRGLDQNDLRARIQRMVPPMLSSDL